MVLALLFIKQVTFELQAKGTFQRAGASWHEPILHDIELVALGIFRIEGDVKHYVLFSRLCV